MNSRQSVCVCVCVCEQKEIQDCKRLRAKVFLGWDKKWSITEKKKRWFDGSGLNRFLLKIKQK